MKKYLVIGSVLIIGLVLIYGTRKTYSKFLNYLGKTKDWLGNPLPRGYKNNNLGNIRISNKAWKGKVAKAQNTDGAFEQFTQFRYGTLAMIGLLTEYINGGHNTLRKIIYRYAPPNENNSQGYLANVSMWSGLGLDTVLKPDKATLKGLVIAMGRIENGKSISDTDFNEGYDLL